jgi:Non-ribosomal peptide synthetase modules and related proteins
MLQKIEEIARKYPKRIAYIINNQEISYKDLWNEAEKHALNLRKQGTTPVLLYGHKSVSMIISILSCLRAERAYIPVEAGTPYLRIMKIIMDAQVSLVIKNEEIDISGVECLRLEELKKFSTEPKKYSKNEIAYLMFTSGSTGDPKGVPISNANLNHFVGWISALYPLSNYKNCNILNQASFSFDLSIADIFYSLCNGHTLIALDKQKLNNYKDMIEYIKKQDINVIVCTPSFIKLCLVDKEFRRENYPNLNCIYFCGELLEVKTVHKLFDLFKDISIINAYGPTEATSAISAVLITEDMLQEEMLPIGDITNLACELSILEGEILLSGNSVFSGYLGEEKGLMNGLYRTGDMGYIKKNLLYWKGRKDYQIKYKGYRIELEGIEQQIKKVEGIIDAVVIAKTFEKRAVVKTIMAFVIVDGTMNEVELREKLKELVPDYMIPKVIKIVEQFPINQNGKVDRKALAQDD